MTELVLGLPGTSLSADKIRSTPADLRRCLTELTGRGHEVWTGPFPALADVLIDVARIDLCLARLVEGHADALRILSQAGADPRPGVYGVWASRSVGTGTTASQLGGRWQLSGELRFASGVDLIDRVLVPAWIDDKSHVLLDVPADCGTPDRESWRTCGMNASHTFTVHIDNPALEAEQVGGPNFYLDRPGFVVGGLGPAAVWVGGAHQVLDVVTTSLRPFPTNPHQLRRVGVMEQAVWEAGRLLHSTVAGLEGCSGEALAREISMTRTAVVRACETVLDEASRVVGPAGLSRNARLARAMEDLAVYVRQHHLDTALASLGEHALSHHELLAG